MSSSGGFVGVAGGEVAVAAGGEVAVAAGGEVAVAAGKLRLGCGGGKTYSWRSGSRFGFLSLT